MHVTVNVSDVGVLMLIVAAALGQPAPFANRSALNKYFDVTDNPVVPAVVVLPAPVVLTGMVAGTLVALRGESD